ncbi:hypothetical protein CL3_02710 [butyrate-producing bacterium SM4/1]|nr:hypothetical protein CL3_02710 [butyrate-producing bacterium SM4/1]
MAAGICGCRDVWARGTGECIGREKTAVKFPGRTDFRRSVGLSGFRA